MSNEQIFSDSISRSSDTDSSRMSPRPVTNERTEKTEQCVELGKMEIASRSDQVQTVSPDQARSASFDRDEKNQQSENPNNLVAQRNDTVYLPAAAIIVDRHDTSNSRSYKKVLVSGEDIEGSHKTKFCYLLMGKIWEDNVPTVFDNSILTLGEKNFSIWDTAGQAGLKLLIRINYPQSDIIFVFGKTTQEVQKWANDFTQHEEKRYEEIRHNAVESKPMSFFNNRTNPISETTYKYYKIHYDKHEEAIGQFDLVEVEKIKDIDSISRPRQVNRELTIPMVRNVLSRCDEELLQQSQSKTCVVM